MGMQNSDLKFLTTEWLTNVLTKAGYKIGEVLDFKIKSEVRYVTSIHYLDITYSANEFNHQLNRLFLKVYKKNLYHDISKSKEVEFYNFFSYNMPKIGFISCISAGFIKEENIAYVLLLDLSDTHYSLAKAHRCTEEQLKQLVVTLGKFHAYWWDHPKLGKGIGEYLTREAFSEYIRDLERRLPVFIDIMGDNLPIERKRVYEKILNNWEIFFRRLNARKNLTIIHGDANPFGNVLFPYNPAKESTYLIDWNGWDINLGMKDVAQVIGLNFYPHQRAKFEKNILEAYYNTLLENGIKNYSWEESWYDYRLCMATTLMSPVILSSWRIDLGVWWPYYAKSFLNYESLYT